MFMATVCNLLCTLPSVTVPGSPPAPCPAALLPMFKQHKEAFDIKAYTVYVHTQNLVTPLTK